MLTKLEAVITIAQTMSRLNNDTRSIDRMMGWVDKALIMVDGTVDHELRREAIIELRKRYPRASIGCGLMQYT